jgi:F420-dependent oxidoreductase-like protein
MGIMAGYSGKRIEIPMEMIKRADEMGVYAVWTAEAYGSDAVSPLAWVGGQTKNIKLGTAIMQMPARTPALTATTAITIDQLSGGRMLLGLGLSGPQVVEGWHGQPYGKPLGKTREYVEIIRKVWARTEALEYSGAHYQIPYQGPDATGLGKPLKSIIHNQQPIPIYLAAVGPKNVELSAEIADGWLPFMFAPRFYDSVYKDQLEAGFAKAGGGKSIADFDIAPSVPVAIGDDLEQCYNMVRPLFALYIGGMGAKDKNFYNDAMRRYGFNQEADTIQELYLSGRQGEAMAAVTDKMLDEMALCGDKARVKDLLDMWKASPVTTMNFTIQDMTTLETLAELIL